MNTIENTVSNILINNIEETFKNGCRFVGLTYTNKEGETSRHNLIMGVRLESLYKHDLETLQSILPSCEGIRRVACQELIDSLTESLTKGIGNNSSYTLKGYYQPITKNGEVKFHIGEDGSKSLYLRGYRIKKTVLKDGTYKVVKSQPKTVEKNKLRKLLKTNRIKTFCIKEDQLHSVKLNGMTVEIN
jgi:hypothetical protein